MTIKTLIVALLLDGITAALAADTNGQLRHSELFSTSLAYQQSWLARVKNVRRLPDWVINLNASRPPRHSLGYEVGTYRVNQLCEEQTCFSQRLST